MDMFSFLDDCFGLSKSPDLCCFYFGCLLGFVFGIYFSKYMLIPTIKTINLDLTAALSDVPQKLLGHTAQKTLSNLQSVNPWDIFKLLTN